MVYRWVEHTGELELEIEAEDEEAVYAEALEAMAELLGDPEAAAAARRPAPAGGGSRRLVVEEPDRSRLLAGFVGELAFLAETGGFVPVALERLCAGRGRLEAAVRGRDGDPPQLVKGVTLHRLGFDAVDGGWRATLVLDV